MKRELSLIKNTVILSIGSFFPKFTSIITLPILTAMLTKSEYGTYDLIATLVSLLLPVATLQIQSAAFRFLIECKGDKEKSSKIVSNIFVVIIPVSILAIIILFLAFSALPAVTRVFICLYFFFDILEITLLQITRGVSENKAYSLAAVILSSVNLFLVLLFWVRKTLNLEKVMLSLALSSALATVYLVKVLRRHAQFSIKYVSVKTIKEMLGYSWPMVFNNLSRWSLSLSDRLVITGFLGIEANAVYAVATKIPNLLATLQSTFSMAWQENASIAVDDRDSSEYYSKMFDVFFCFMCGMLAILIAFTPLLFKLLIHGDYKEAYPQMPLLFLGMLFDSMAAYLSGIYVANKKTKSIGTTTVLAALINLTIDLLLVNRIGITAGSLSTMISYLILMVYRMKDIEKVQKITYNIPKIMGIILGMIVMCVLCWLQITWINILNIILSIVVAALINQEILRGMHGIIRTKIKKRHRR